MTGTLRRLLREKFAPPAYALFEEVKNQTGYQKRAERYADALALSLWPSRGITMTGFELKVSRGDWRKELDDPAKAAEFSKYCHAWYVVAPEGIVERLELPATWGLIEVPTAGRKRLVTKVEAPKLTPEPWDQAFVAALLRRQAEHLNAYVQESMQAQLAGERERAAAELEQARERASRGEKRMTDLYNQLLDRLGLSRYDGWSTEIEAAADRMRPRLDEAKAEQNVLWQTQQVTGTLKSISAAAERALEAFAGLEAAAERARVAAQEARTAAYQRAEAARRGEPME